MQSNEILDSYFKIWENLFAIFDHYLHMLHERSEATMQLACVCARAKHRLIVSGYNIDALSILVCCTPIWFKEQGKWI